MGRQRLAVVAILASASGCTLLFPQAQQDTPGDGSPYIPDSGLPPRDGSSPTDGSLDDLDAGGTPDRDAEVPPPICDPEPCPCGGTSVFVEDFEDPAIPLWADNDAVDVAGGVLTIPPNGRLLTAMAYDMRGDTLEMELGDVPVGVEGDVIFRATSYFRDPHVTFRLQVRATGNRLLGDLSDAANEQVFGIDFDSVEHHFWRFREADDRIYWDTSADGLSWSPQGDRATSGFAAHVYGELETSTAGNFVGSIDGVRGGDHDETYCPIANLREDFLGDVWPLWSARDLCDPEVVDGEMVVPAPGCSDPGVFSSHGYILEHGTVIIELPGLSDGAGASAYVRISRDDEHYLSVHAAGGELSLAIQNGNESQPYSIGTYASNQTTWLKVSQEQNDVTFDTAADEGAWEPQGTYTSPLENDPVILSFRAAGADLHVGSVNIRPN